MSVHFRALWQRTIGAARADEAFEALDAGYTSPARAYHDWSHVVALLRGLDRVRSLPEFGSVAFDEVELAIFFHDAIYDSRRRDSEARSVALFLGLAEDSASLAADALARVARLIEATAYHDVSADVATQLLLDLDLSILGVPAETYATYVRQVRREYAHVPDALWVQERRAVLERFLARERIYQTSDFHDRLEASARVNLAVERAELLQAGPDSR